MIVIVGYLLCLGCIFGAFIIHGGNISVILHAMPTEMMAIGGGAIGAFLVNNQPKVVKAVLSSFGPLLKGSKYTKDRYMELMAMLYAYGFQIFADFAVKNISNDRTLRKT